MFEGALGDAFTLRSVSGGCGVSLCSLWENIGLLVIACMFSRVASVTGHLHTELCLQDWQCPHSSLATWPRHSPWLWASTLHLQRWTDGLPQVYYYCILQVDNFRP